jgi:hypothetical protein
MFGMIAIVLSLVAIGMAGSLFSRIDRIERHLHAKDDSADSPK